MQLLVFKRGSTACWNSTSNEINHQTCERIGQFQFEWCSLINGNEFEIINNKPNIVFTFVVISVSAGGLADLDPFYQRGSSLIPAWISNYIHEITYSFQNFNGAAVKVWKRISNFIPQYTEHMITYPCWDQILIHANKRSPWSPFIVFCCVWLFFYCTVNGTTSQPSTY